MTYSIIIPYRDRQEHLRVLLPRLQDVFKNESYEIIIAEQNDAEKFKLSSLYNIAYNYTIGEILVFHDVDYVPSENVSYDLVGGNPTYPVRQVVFLNENLLPKNTEDIPAGYRHFNYDVGNHWGGVFIMHRRHFELINGFNPLYVGWGKEEEETRLRLFEKGLTCERNQDGLFYALDHKDNCPPPTDTDFIKNHRLLANYKTNLHIGYKNVSATVEEFRAGENIKWLKINNFVYENFD